MGNPMVTYSTDAAFGALADPIRRAVLQLLRTRSLPAGQIASAFPVSRPAVSKHLRILRRARLVRERRDGRNRVYELNPAPLQAVDGWIGQYRSFWQTSLQNLKSVVEADSGSAVHNKKNSKKKGPRKRK